MANSNLFHTPGVYYRPKQLKSIKCLLGNSEKQTVYQNFNLQNLNTNALDNTHLLYERYLQTNGFIPPGDKSYFEHMQYGLLPTTVSDTDNKGLFNIFPLSLTDDALNKTSSTNIGTIKNLFEFFILLF